MAGRVGGGGSGGGRVIGDYNVTQQIGTGSFAVVWKAHHKQRPGVVAIKEIATERLNKKLQESLRSEIEILQRAKHPNIIKLHDIVEGPNRIYLVLEYCAGGDLFSYIQQYGKVSEAVARHFMRQLGAGLQVLRQNHLIHRDLKPQNLLLSTNDSHAVLKIADFGFARSLQPQGMAETLCGSPLYMAPEILQQKRYDAKADLWSVGAILFQLVTGRPPFSGNNHVQLLQNIMKSNEVRFSEDLMEQLHPDCIDMCRKLLRRNPVERLSFDEFFNHPFMGAMRPKADDSQPVGSNSGGTGETSETSDQECFPLDEQQTDGTTSRLSTKPPPFLPSSSPLLPPIGRKQPLSGTSPPPRLGFPSPDLMGDRTRNRGQVGLEERPTFLEAEYNSAFNVSSTKGGHTIASPVTARAYQKLSDARMKGLTGTLENSIDTIEREYVLVAVPQISTENLAMSSSVSDVGGQNRGSSGSPQKIPSNLNITTTNSGGGVGSAGSNASVPSHSSQESADKFEGPSQHPPTRLSSLQKCARLVTELATGKMESGQVLESFSIQLVCLAIWKEALIVCKSWAETVGSCEHSSSNEGRGIKMEEGEGLSVVNTCSLMEREFAFAVQRAETLSSHITVVHPTVEMPDAMELIFQAALAFGRVGAVEELYGNLTSAAEVYAKAASLLYFLVVEAVALPLQPPLLLSDNDRHRLRKYADHVTLRQHQCVVNAQARPTILTDMRGTPQGL